MYTDDGGGLLKIVDQDLGNARLIVIFTYKYPFYKYHYLSPGR